MQLAIYVSDDTDLTLLDTISDLYQEHMPFLVLDSQCSNQKIPNTKYACINFYHLSYYQEKIIFLNHKDFNKRSSDLICEKTVVVEKENLIKLEKSLMNNVNVLIKDNNKKIRKAKNAEIQSVLR
jgi:hypothetical protein